MKGFAIRKLIGLAVFGVQQYGAWIVLCGLLLYGIQPWYYIQFAFAAVGDFSIFRDNSGTDSIPSNGASTTVKFDTTVTSAASIPITSETSIDLSETGKYLVLYNVVAEEGTSTGNNRRSFETWLEVNGTPSEYGWSGGYIRDTQSDLRAYPNGAAIIDVTAGDDLTVNIRRTDSNTTAGSNFAQQASGVQILKFKDSISFARVHQSVNISNVQTNTAFTAVTWDTIDELDTDDFAFTGGNSNVTLTGASGDHYLMMVTVALDQVAGNNTRQNYVMRLTRDGVEIPGTRTSAYIRGSDGTRDGYLNYVGIVRKESITDEDIVVQIRREDSGGGATTDIMADRSSFAIAKLPSTGQFISLLRNTDLSLTTSDQAVSFDEQIELDSGYFTHSTTTNPSRIEVDVAGDYLFFSTIYSTRSANIDNRDTPVATWRRNGSATYQYGSHASFLRGQQGTGQVSNESGSSGGVIINNLTPTDYLELMVRDNTSGATDSFLDAGFVAVQAAEISLLFNTDVEVTAIGSQQATTSIPVLNFNLGGTYVFTETDSTRDITSITITESGTIDAQTNIDNIELRYDLDTSAPYDCASESYSSGDTQFGSTDTDGFSGADGFSTFADTVTISTTSTLCLYVELDVLGGALDGETIKVSINNPVTDVAVDSGSVGPGELVTPLGSTSAFDDNLVQTHYHWRNDDGNEGGASSATGGLEDTTLDTLTIADRKRLRIQISNEGNATSDAVALRLEYAEKISTCDAIGAWTDVGAVGGAWDMSDTTAYNNGDNSTDIVIGIGGVTNENTVFKIANGGLLDTSSQAASQTLTSSQYTELEYSIEATLLANENSTYCFRVTDAGVALPQYDIYPEASIVPNVTVSTLGTQVGTVTDTSTDNYLGGTFVFANAGGPRTITDITLTSTGTINAIDGLATVTLAYEFDTVNPYDCAGESYGGGESTVLGSVFTGPAGSTTFSGTFNIDDDAALCGYIVFDTTASSSNGETINFVIDNPQQDVVVSAGSVGPSSVVDITGVTIIESPILNLQHYHWRNNDGSETGATSATGGSEDTPLTDVRRGSARRLRLAVTNDGLQAASNNAFRLEYGEKITTCDAIANWQDVATGPAFNMFNSSFLIDGDDTIDIAPGIGGVSNEDTFFLSPNGGIKDTSSQTDFFALDTDEFVELEYSIQVTSSADFDTTYCFRLTNSGTEFETYSVYPELTTFQRQDFFVQRGTVTISGTSTTLFAGNQYDAPLSSSSAFIRITNTGHTGAGSTLTGSQTARDVTAYILNPENILESITIARPTGAINNTRVSWEIIEYIGLEGGDNEMVVRDHGTVQYGATSLSVDGDVVSGVADDADVVVFTTGIMNPSSDVNNYNDMLTTAEWDSSNARPVFTRGDADSLAVRVSYAVVEFTGLNWIVQRAEHTYTADGVAEIESITPVNDPTRVFIHAQKRVANQLNGLDEYGHQVWLSSVGAVSFQLRSGAGTPSDHTSVAWVIENTQNGTGEMEVYRTSGTDSGGTEPGTNVYPIGATLTGLNNAAIFVNNDSSGTGTAFPRTIIGVSLDSTTQYGLWQSDNGQNQDFRTEVVEFPTAQLAVRQNYYRWYVDNDALDPVDPWPTGPTDVSENEAIGVDRVPLGEGDRIRLRMTLAVRNATLPADTFAYKLQFAPRVTTCSAISAWNTLGDAASTTVWRGYNGTPVDGTALSTDPPGVGDLNISVSDVAGTYEEDGLSATNTYAASPNEDIEYDWVIEHNGAVQRTDYCFRMVQIGGTELDAYDNYPTLRTSAYEPVVANWRWYNDETNITPTTPLAGEEVTPVDVPINEIVKLRVRLDESQGAAGENIRFGLQFSESSTFADGGTFVLASTSCLANSLWCYEDGAGVDDALIPSTVLSGVDSCVASVGDGCGTHNESTTTPSTFDQPARAQTEFEFTIRHAGARANAVYYFRPYDLTNDVAVAASSSFPSLQTDGAGLTFTISGLPSGTTTEGVTTDATTTATAVEFGSLPLNTQVEAAHRLSIDTNATEGYQILAFTRQDLQASHGEIIAPINATNTNPASWALACDGSTTGCFGYHPGDDTLAGGSTRFAPDDSYAAFEVTPREILYSTFPTVESHDVIYKIQVDEMQPAGIYESQIVYIAVPRF